MEFLDEHGLSILNRAVQQWGIESQWSMAIGECGEFVALEGKRVQGRLSDYDALDEIADVLVMMHQMSIVYGYELVKQRIDYKLSRLELKLNSAEGDDYETTV